MKLLLFLVGGFFNNLHNSDSTNLYQMQFNSLDSGIINLASYTGKRIVVTAFNANSPNTSQLRSFDSLFKMNNGQVQVIAIPVQDFGTPMQNDSLTNLLRNTLHISFPIAAVSYGQKSFASDQHVLLQWLTHVNKNTHFDDDVVEGQIFIISNSGTLYSVLRQVNFPGSSSIIQDALNNQPQTN